MDYPIILLPSETPTLQFSVSTSGKNKKTGASELVAFSHVLSLGIEDIREDVSVVIDGHRYEPDFVYIDKERSIYVDIEIDEPYSSGHHPTHYLTTNGSHKDARRNELFRKAGWIVVRFTERQMFCETKACMKTLYDLLSNKDLPLTMPTSLQQAEALSPTPCWTAEEAKGWSYKRYRKTYLGYDPVNMDFSSHLRCCILIIPIIFQSFKNTRIRKMMLKQFRGFFLL